MEFVTYDELFEQSQALFKQSQDIALNKEANAEELEKGMRMFEEGTKLRERSQMLVNLEARIAETTPEAPAPNPSGGFKTLGNMLQSIHGVTFTGRFDKRLTMAEGDLAPQDGKSGWATESKDLVENIGASGGFLVFPEHLTRLFQMDPLDRLFRQRATVLPMRARVMQVPVLDQTGAPSAGSSYYGGALAVWTEEAKSKDESQPKFRQMQLTAHKLVVYTEASDELLADSAIPLESLIQTLFRDTVLNEEEYAFMLGSGAGQPLGVITANTSTGMGPTIVVPRAVALQISIEDIFDMVERFQGRNPIWIAHQSAMRQILGLNGPATSASPNYVWIGNGRDQMPTTLMGYPIYFVENAEVLGTMGDIGLYDLSKYLIGDRQMVTLDASKHYRFQYDLTSWRAVHRVDGRPWLSAPITYRDGATTVSPFVILGDVDAS